MKKWLKIIAGVFVGLIVIGMVFGGGEETTKVETTDSTEQTSESTEAKADYNLTDVAVENDGLSTYVVGVLSNDTDKDKSYVSVTFPVYDQDGNKVGEALANVNDLKAGTTWKFKAIYLGSEKDVKIDLENPKVKGF